MHTPRQQGKEDTRSATMIAYGRMAIAFFTFSALTSIQAFPADISQPPSNDSTTTSDPTLILPPQRINGSISTNIPINTTLTQPGMTFEQRVSSGIQYLQDHGVSFRASTRLILGHPTFTKARKASDFIYVQLSMVDRAKRTDYKTQNYPYTDGKWVLPSVHIEKDGDWMDWDPQDEYLRLEDAVKIVNQFGEEGPWEVLSAYLPAKDPEFEGRAIEPFFGFHTTPGEPFTAVGMRSHKCIKYKPAVDPTVMQFPVDAGLEEVTS